MEMPTYCILHQNSVEQDGDLVTYTDDTGNTAQRIGLYKQVPRQLLKGPIGDIANYMLQETGDDWNVPYSESESDLASLIRDGITESQSHSFLLKRNGRIDTEHPIEPNELFSAYSHEALQEVRDPLGQQPHYVMEMVVEYYNGGGASL